MKEKLSFSTSEVAKERRNAVFKVVHNTLAGFVREAKKSELPVRVGVKNKLGEAERKGDVSFVYFYIVATAVIDGMLHEYWVLAKALPIPFLDDEVEKARTNEDCKKTGRFIKEQLEKEGVEVLMNSYYEVAENEKVS